MPLGLLGRAVLDALVAGERDPAALRSVVGTVAKAGRDSIRVAFTGCIGEPHRFILRSNLRHDDALAAAEIDANVKRDLDPFGEAAELLATIPGVE